MRHFFVDTENTNNYNFVERFDVCSSDKVHLFYTEKSKRIDIVTLANLTKKKVKIEYEEAMRGSESALDFQLMMGLAVAVSKSKNKNDVFYIISNDQDFLIPAKSLAKKSGYKIELIAAPTDHLSIQAERDEIRRMKSADVNNSNTTINVNVNVNVSTDGSVGNNTDANIVYDKADCTNNVNDTVYTYEPANVIKAPANVRIAFKNSKSLSEFYCTLVKDMGVEAGREIYHKLKGTFEQKQKFDAINAVSESDAINKIMAKARNKQELNNMLSKTFGNKRAHVLYEKLVAEFEAAKMSCERTATNINDTNSITHKNQKDDSKSKIERIMNECASLQNLYLSFVKEFGAKKGLEIYRTNKEKFAKMLKSAA